MPGKHIYGWTLLSNDDVDRLSDKKGMHQSALTDLISIISKGWIDPLRKYRILLIKGKDVTRG